MANQFSIDVDQSNDGIKVVSVPKTWLEGGNTPNWITPVVNYGMTSGGILIPQRVDSEGRPEITQYGRNVPLESLIFDRKGELTPTTIEVLLDIPNKPCHLESLALASNNNTIGVNIFAYDKDGKLSPRLGLPVADGTDILTVSASVLQNYWDGENDFFKVFLYDTQNNRYSVGMKRQTVFNNGLRITVANYSQAAYNVAVTCLVSTWED